MDNMNAYDILDKIDSDSAQLFEDMFGDLFRETNHLDGEYEYTVNKGQDMSLVTMSDIFKKKNKE